jgi:glycosyltransferase involved in cell wall biosynthesis
MAAETKVSIVIPCLNEERYIGSCLDSVVSCGYPKELLRVFVCDGESSDRTREIVTQYANSFPFIRLLINDDRTAPYAMNLGLNAAPFDVGIILGAHAEIAPDFVQRCVTKLSEIPEAGCVGGIIENVYENETSEAIGKAMSSVFGVGNAHFRTGTKSGFVDTVAFGAYRKDVFDTCGFFDEELTRNQDDEFNFRLLQSGFKIWLDPEIKSRYFVRASFSKLFRQYNQYGYWKVYVNRKHHTVTTVRQLVPALWILFLCGGLAGSFLHPAIGMLFLSGVLFYLFFSLAFALKTADKITQTGKILWAFWILHFSYGTGYLKGIRDFFIWGKKPSEKKSRLSR